MSSKSKKSDGELSTLNVDNLPYFTPRNRPPRSALDFSNEKSRTHQNFKNECDVNVIVDRAQKAGFYPPPPSNLVFADVSNAVDYQTALNSVLRINDHFAALPSAVRKRFQNDPAGFLAFCSDPANRAEMQSLGLLSSQLSEAQEPSGAAKRPKAGEAAPDGEAPTGA